MIHVVDRLQPVSIDQRAAILVAPKTAASHRELLANTPAMTQVELGGQAQASDIPQELTIAAWNLERCLFVEHSARKLAHLGADIVLLSEVDAGMARSGQRHTTRDLAAELGMQYCYGVEFYEMGLGGPIEIERFCQDHHNEIGWHGNAILSKYPMDRVTMVRLDDHGHWFCTDKFADPAQPRIGGRMAILAMIGGICYVSTHLESAADAAHRTQQMDVLIAAIDGFAPGCPVLIGGDLNTGNHMPPNYDWRDETLFDFATQKGFDWSFNAQGMTTRPSLITINPAHTMKLDWFAARDMRIQAAGIETSLHTDGTPVSDHDCIWLKALTTT